MKHAFWAYGIIALGIAILVGLRFVNDLTTTSEADYYMTKEIMEAAMLDSIDYGVYRRYGDLRIIKEKFVENFIKRFSMEVRGSKTYSIEFYEIYEEPVKATVLVRTSTGEFQVSSDTTLESNIMTVLSGIVETKYKDDCIDKKICRDEDSYEKSS